MKCLSETERPEIFENRSIRAVLDYKWPSIKSALTFRLFAPYVLFLLTFIYFSVIMVSYYGMVNNTKDLKDLMEKKGIENQNDACMKSFFSDKEYVYQQAHIFNVTSDQMDDYCDAVDPKNIKSINTWKFWLEILLVVFVAYFFFNELRQMKDGMKEYLMNVWNYVDLMPLALISVILFSNLVATDGKMA